MFGVLVYFKNEQNCIYEWVTHYKLWGAQHIWMIDNGSTDNSVEILEPFIRDGFVTLWSEPFMQQETAYNKYFSTIQKETKWLGVFDMDEFLYSKISNNLSNLLKPLSKKYKVISIQSKIFYPGTFSSPPSVIEHSTLVKGFDSKLHPKSIYNIGYLSSVTIHGNKERKQCKSSHRVLYTPEKHLFCINHYRFSSFEYLYGIKTGRGGGVNKSKYKKINVINTSDSVIIPIEDDYLKKNSSLLIEQCKNNHTPPNTDLYPNTIWKKMEMFPKKIRQFNSVKNLSIKQLKEIQKFIHSL